MEEGAIVREFLYSQTLHKQQSRTKCPLCGPDRTNHTDRSLSVKLDGADAIYLCHHCLAKGVVNLEEPEIAAVIPKRVGSLSSEQVSFLRERGISEATAVKAGVISGKVYIGARKLEVNCLGFPYLMSDGTTAVKWRDGQKHFTQTGSARAFWRIEEWSGGDLVVCEGEMDALAFREAGVFAVSVPNGAPAARVEDLDSQKFSYLWDAKEHLKKAKRILIATDADGPGQLLADEIARRVGKARCWRVRFPNLCKDPNDVLLLEGAEALRKAIEESTPWPVEGIRSVGEFRAKAEELLVNGMDRGCNIGIPKLDAIFRINPQTLNLITGIPGSGKSAFLTWMATRLAADKGWGCAVFSAEVPTEIHLLQIASCYLNKPSTGPSKMSISELQEAIDWISTRFVFFDEADSSVSSILERAEAAVLRSGVRMLIIDPYNFLTNPEDGVEGINKMLIALKTFSVQHDLAVCLVAHPKKMYRDSSGRVPAVTGYDVAASSGFFNVSDAGVTVSRVASGKTMLACWKARFPWVGQLGECILDFDWRVGTFGGNHEEEEEDDGLAAFAKL